MAEKSEATNSGGASVPASLSLRAATIREAAREDTRPTKLKPSSDTLREIDRFFRDEHKIIIPLTVREILDGEIERKLA